MNNVSQPQQHQVSFGPMDLLNIRLGLEQIEKPSPMIKEAIDQLDDIINKLVMGFAPAPTLANSPDFPFPTASN